MDTRQSGGDRSSESNDLPSRLTICVDCECGRTNHVAIELTSGSATRVVNGGGAAAGVGPHMVRVLRLVARGLTDREIATTLCMSVPQVKYQIRDCLARLSARNRTEAVLRAMEAGLVTQSWMQVTPSVQENVL
jgi:DNA-binding CsgD family transcriptional regulator